MNLENIRQKLVVLDRRAKLYAFEELQKYCENPKTTQEEVLSAFDECYLYMLKCYSDRYESVRDQAAHTVSQFLERLPTNDFHLSNIICTLFERMGHDETLEESEEIRLMYVQQLHSLILRYPSGNDEALQQCYDSLELILKKSIRDTHPAVQRESCACVVSLARSASKSQRFQKMADTLAKSLYCVLNHKHSLARIAAVEALGQLSLHIDCKGDALSRLIMEISPLLMDSMPLVRRECGQMGILMLMDLPDRYSYFERIIPLVLSCLKDDSPEVASHIRPLWVKCGQQYFEENEAELRKIEISDTTPEGYPEGVERPTIGCRALVQRSLRLLSIISRESADWKDNVRLHSLRLLYQFVLHAEAAMTAKFFEIYPDIARACRDYEYTVSKEAMKVADLMGRLFSYDDWFEHGFEGLAKNAREGYLKCFYAMFNAAVHPKLTDLLRVSKILVNPDFSQTLKPDFQKYIIKLTEVILQKLEKLHDEENENCNEFFSNIERNVYIVTAKVIALSFSTEINRGQELKKRAEKIFQILANRQHISLPELHEKYLAAALEFVQNLDAPLDGLSEPILLLNGLIGIAKFRSTYLQKLQEKINMVWQNCSSEAKIKIFSTISIEILGWSETIRKDVVESSLLLKDFLESVVEMHLSWRAGATAETMRSLATATLCAVSQGAPKESQLILPSFAKYIPSLLEDHAVNTRFYAIKAIANFGEIPLDDLKPVAYATLQRLDDPSSDIRVLAATVIMKLKPKFPADSEESLNSLKENWDTFLKKALDVLMIHYDGPDRRLKDVIRGTIMEFAHSHPHVVSFCFKRANEQLCDTRTNLQDLKDQLPPSAWN